MNSGPVLQLITGLGVGGAERVVMELAGAMSQDQQSVMVVSLTEERGILGQYPLSPFPVKSLGMQKGSRWSLVRALLSIIRLVRNENIRVIHAHMFHAMILALLCKIFCGRRISVVFTSHSFAGFKGPRKILIKLTRWFRSADIVFSKIQHPKLNARSTFVIPNGVKIPSMSERNSESQKRIFLFVGRLEEPKDPLALIDAFSKVHDKKSELWIAGDGSLRETIEKRISLFNLKDRIKLLGVRTDIPDLFRQVDCFVMSSRWEGLPMALLEAGAAGLPVIATPVGAIPEIIEKNAGFLSASKNLATTIDSIIKDYDVAREAGAALRRRISDSYSLSTMHAKHLAVYRSLST